MNFKPRGSSTTVVQKSCDAKQLQFTALCRTLLEEPINDVDTQVEGCWFQTKLHVDLHQPINHNGSHVHVELWLLVHARVGARGGLGGKGMEAQVSSRKGFSGTAECQTIVSLLVHRAAA